MATGKPNYKKLYKEAQQRFEEQERITLSYVEQLHKAEAKLAEAEKLADYWWKMSKDQMEAVNKMYERLWVGELNRLRMNADEARRFFVEAVSKLDLAGVEDIAELLKQACTALMRPPPDIWPPLDECRNMTPEEADAYRRVKRKLFKPVGE